MSECNHEWSTKYTKRFYADGVEWFCIHCHETLPWPDAKRMVNEYAELKRENEEMRRGLKAIAGKPGYEIDCGWTAKGVASALLTEKVT